MIVTYSDTDEGPHYQAVRPDPAGDEDPVALRVGGQEVELPRRYLIGLDSASRAAMTFIETAERPEALDWEPC